MDDGVAQQDWALFHDPFHPAVRLVTEMTLRPTVDDDFPTLVLEPIIGEED